MGAPRLDLYGQVLGNLTVVGLDRVEPKHGTMWLCRCTCGDLSVYRGSHLTAKNTPRCMSRDSLRRPQRGGSQDRCGREYLARNCETDGALSMSKSRCWGCCQENCGYTYCTCICHGSDHEPIKFSPPAPIPNTMKVPCHEHRSYQAKRKPRTACEACWRFYIRMNP